MRLTDAELAREVNEFNERFPSAQMRLPGASGGRGIHDWLAHDLLKLRELSEAAGAKFVLQTYPPYRGSLVERAADEVIRKVAGENKIVLSDVSQGFRALEAREPGAAISERYFRKEGESFQDDHLNGAGNAVVAELLLKSLEAAGVAR